MRHLRLVFGSLLVVLAFLTVLSVPGEAHAQEPASPPVVRIEPGTLASARRLLLAGDFVAARYIVDQYLLAAHDDAAREEAREVLGAVDTWASRGARPRAASSDLVSEVPDATGDWDRDLIVAREILLRGAYAESVSRLDTLVATAPDPVASARASQLRTLAREALLTDVANHAEPARVAVSPGPIAHGRAPAREARSNDWYGWQNLLVDGGAVVVTPLQPLVGLGAYVVGSPIVHAAHGRVGTAAASLGLRLGLPVASALTVYALSDRDTHCGDFGCRSELYALLAGGVGMLAAAAIDDVVLAWEKRELDGDRSHSRSMLGSIVPTAGPRAGGGADIAVVGSF